MERIMKRKQEQLNAARGSNDAHWLARMADAVLHESDQRESPRKPVSLVVSLNEFLTCLGRGWIRDMSLNGAFVRLSDQRLQPGMAIQIGFPFLFAGLPIERRVTADVVRVEPGGVAIRFQKYNPDFYGDLTSLLDTA
jgi:hypothetical protein